MPAAEAHVQTADPDKYLIRLCRHATKMGDARHHRPRAHGSGNVAPDMQHADWSGRRGKLLLNWGQCTLQASPGALILRAEAADQETLARIVELVTARLERFGRREHLTVSWQPVIADQDGASLA